MADLLGVGLTRNNNSVCRMQSARMKLRSPVGYERVPSAFEIQVPVDTGV